MKKKENHHTEDPGIRAADIADREAEKVWKQTGDFKLFLDTRREIFRAALAELAGSVGI